MKQIATIIPCYAADTSGVCAALYELGGMVAVHDASGVNSTYATHDEPRWETQRSMIYVSALTELDAILGNDEKFIADVVSAAHDQQPRFIAVCGSPMPMMIGVDFDAVAREIEQRSGIRTFALHTNGMHSYSEGAAEALCCIAEEYVQPTAQKCANGVNILGATPLDFGNMQEVQSIREWLEMSGFAVVSCYTMGDGIETLSRAAEASVNLVVSYSGLAAAQYLCNCFDIPYVCGVPLGGAFSASLADALRQAAKSGKNAYPCAFRGVSGEKIAVIGEQIYAGSIAAQLGMTGHAAQVICPLPHDFSALAAGDYVSAEEGEIAKVLAVMQPETVIADPLYRFILPQSTGHIELPHYAFSGRCFETKMQDLVGARFEEWSCKGISMTLSELYNHYYFHDSVLEKIEYHDHEVKLYCQFCDFMQANYNDKDALNSNIIVIFHNAVYQINGNWEIHDAVFLNQRIEDDSIIFFMESSPDQCGEFIIKASSVEVITTRTYNL